MDPKITQFMFLNGLVVLILVAYMFFWRPKRRPTRLKLRESGRGNKLDSSSVAPRSNPDPLSSETLRLNSEPNVRVERQLTAVFQFNGHDFEAYEVLGLAAGSSHENVEKAYQQILITHSPDTLEIYRMAYETILRQKPLRRGQK